jgi:hypothetical protein
MQKNLTMQSHPELHTLSQGNQVVSSCKTNMASDDMGMLMQGSLPVDWGLDTTFPKLQNLTLSFNPSLGGTLPEAWGSDGSSFQVLSKLEINNCNVSGTLPAAWATTLPALKDINVSTNSLTGESWPRHVQNLQGWQGQSLQGSDQ